MRQFDNPLAFLCVIVGIAIMERDFQNARISFQRETGEKAFDHWLFRRAYLEAVEVKT